MTQLEIPEPVASFIGAVNANDEEAFLNAFADEGSVDDWGRTFLGREQIKSWSDKEFIGAKGTLAVETVERDGAAIVVIGDWRSTYANGRSKFTFDVAGDRIVTMTIREG